MTPQRGTPRLSVFWLLGAVIAAGILVSCGSPATTSSPTASPPSPTGPLTHQSRELVNQNISVLARTNYDIPFNVTANVYNVRVVGSFNTFGGLPNTIQVYIMSDAVYSDWLKGRTVDIVYDSGSRSTGNFDVSITKPGNYHLLFSNYAEASVAPAQQVTANVTLQWDEAAAK